MQQIPQPVEVQLTSSWDKDDPLSSILLTQDDIIERVDEYSLYCFYLGYEPIPHRGRYRSPIRTTDDNPSFGIFYSKKNPKREFLWKDQATGQVGDIFRLVQLMFQYSNIDQGRQRVLVDTGLAKGILDPGIRIEYHQTPQFGLSRIRVKSRPFFQPELNYWKDINIFEPTLERYIIRPVQLYWLFEDQQEPYFGKQFYFSYQVQDKYQLYNPYEKKDYKFRNDFTDQHILGLSQLQYNSKLLVITKSLKDVAFLSTIGYEAISSRSENTPILPEILRAFETRYSKLVTLFDNDGKHRADFYNYPELHIPISVGYKDPTDVARYKGVQIAKEIVDNLLQPYAFI